MFKRFQNYLLTNHPLIWNTRVTWVIGACIIIHILFFISGYANVSANELQNYYNMLLIGGEELYTFSILCSLGVIIFWFIFYLRNNALKSFYTIDKRHSVKEFCIIAITFTFITGFFQSYQLGGWLKTRHITSQTEFVKEVNTINQALAFIPFSKEEYFKLNNCEQNSRHYDESHNYFDTTLYNYQDSNNIAIRAALLEPDAFSYKNYCTEFFPPFNYLDGANIYKWRAKNRSWIDNHQIDSIKDLLGEFTLICKKYDIKYKLDIAALSNLPFADSFHKMSKVALKTEPNYRENDYQINAPLLEGGQFVNYFDLHQAVNFIDKCYLNPTGRDDLLTQFIVVLYVSLCFAILLLCYRLYTKKSFFISLLGTILLAIIFGLLAASLHNGLGWLYLFLFLLFLTIAILLIGANNDKTLTGIMLNWHVYMVPFVLLVVMNLVIENYDNQTSIIQRSYPADFDYTKFDALMKEKFPIQYWINSNEVLIARLNLLFVFLYVTSFFTKLSRKWHVMPQE